MGRRSGWSYWTIALAIFLTLMLAYTVVVLSIFLGVGVKVKSDLSDALSESGLKTMAASAFSGSLIGDQVKQLLTDALQDEEIRILVGQLITEIVLPNLGFQRPAPAVPNLGAVPPPSHRDALQEGCRGVSDEALCHIMQTTCGELNVCWNTMNTTVCRSAGLGAIRLCNTIRGQ